MGAEILETLNYNEQEIRECYRFLNHEKETEIRLLDPRKEKKPESTFVHNENEFVNTCLEYNGKYNLYAGINERKPFGTSKKEVISVKTLVIDIDAKKPANTSATDLELKEAEKDCDKIIYAMEKVGCPVPIKLHSGNGYQIWIAIPTIEITDENRNSIEEKTEMFQTIIKQRFEDCGSIDQIGDLPRIIKIWGTLNIKGENTEERPWRIAKVIGKNRERIEDIITHKRLLELKKEEIEQIEITKIEDLNKEFIPKPISYLLYEYQHKNPDGWFRIIEIFASFFRGIGLDKEKTISYIIEWARKQPYREQGEEIEALRIIERIYKNQIMCPNFEKIVDKSQGYPYFALKEKFDDVNLGTEWRKYKNPVSYYKYKEQEIKDKEEGFIFSAFGSLTDFLEIAKKFIEIQPLFYDEAKIWWVWSKKEKKWIMKDEVDILNEIDKNTKNPSVNSKIKNELLEALKRVGRLNKPGPIKPTWVQFKDKIYDVNTRLSFEATPKYFVTNPIPWNISQDYKQDTPIMDKIFEQWVGKDYVQTLYEILAYCILPDYPINRLFCFVGGGLNGKSCFQNLINKFIGNDNSCTTELDVLLTSRFEITRLYRKLCCFMGETNFSEMSKTSILKKLTGGDIIGFEFKNKDLIHDKNYAKIIIGTNNLPNTTDKTLGFYRRWMIIDFPNTFTEKKDILSEIPEEEYECLATKCLIVLGDLLKKREFTNEGTIEERMEKFEAKSNFLGQFLKLFVEESPNEQITSKDFSKKFNSWCKENRHREMSDNSLGMAMKKLGYENGKVYFNWMFDGKGGQIRCWLGIRWKN